MVEAKMIVSHPTDVIESMMITSRDYSTPIEVIRPGRLCNSCDQGGIIRIC